MIYSQYPTWNISLPTNFDDKLMNHDYYGKTLIPAKWDGEWGSVLKWGIPPPALHYDVHVHVVCMIVWSIDDGKDESTPVHRMIADEDQ